MTLFQVDYAIGMIRKTAIVTAGNKEIARRKIKTYEGTDFIVFMGTIDLKTEVHVIDMVHREL